MREIKVTRDQIADMAREIARGYGHDYPDILVCSGPAVEVKDPFNGLSLFMAPKPEATCPLWQVFVGQAELALAQAGRLAGVTFVKVEEQEAAA